MIFMLLWSLISRWENQGLENLGHLLKVTQ